MLQNNFICMTSVGCKNTQIVQKQAQEWTLLIFTSNLPCLIIFGGKI